jgi:hypothetical protein
MEFALEQVLAWRVRRHLLDRPPGTTPVAVIDRLCGVQAQVAGCADHAIAVRRPRPEPGAAEQLLAERQAVRTWAMRGTLHLLTEASAPDYLALLAAARTWEKPIWQRNFITVDQLAAVAEVVADALDGAALTRDELTAAVLDRTGDAGLVEHLRSGWGTALKPLAWQGLLVNGASNGSRVTFTSPRTWWPDWPGLPDADDAATRVIPAYLGTYGPASMATFDDWLLRGNTPKKRLRQWFTTLVEAGELTEVTVAGRPAFARAGDLDELANPTPVGGVRLLDAFDQYVLGPGTGNPEILAADRRSRVSRAAGWIAPVVLVGGRVVGTWQVRDDTLAVEQFAEDAPVPADALEAEVARVASYHGRDLTIEVSTV